MGFDSWVKYQRSTRKDKTVINGGRDKCMGIRNYLPVKIKLMNFQVKMPEALMREVQKEMKKDNYRTWQEFLIACFNGYLKIKKEGRENNYEK